MLKDPSDRDVSSYESGTRNSSSGSSQYIEKTSGSIIQYKRQIYIFSQFVFFISFLLIVIALFLPWFSMRNDCTNAFNKLFNHGLPEITQHLTQMLENLLYEYQTTPIFYGSLFDNPNLIEDTDEYIEKFISFTKKSYEIYPIMPLAFLLNSSDNIIYESYFPNSSTSTCELYVQYSENGQLIKKFYPTDYNYQNFNHLVDGIPVEDLPGLTNDFFDSNETWITSPSFFNDSYHTLLSANVKTASNISLCLILDLQSLINLLQSILPNPYFRYVFMTANGGVLFDNELGIIEANESHFPHLKDLNDEFWDEVSKLPFNQSQERIEINETVYLLNYGYIISLDEASFSFLISVAKDNIMAIPLRKLSLYFMLMVLIVGVIYTISKYFMYKNKEKCQKRLNRGDRSTSMNSYLIDSYSTLHNCIIQLRMVELMYPEEMVLNHVLDKIVQEISENRYRHFVLKKKANCGFCDFIAMPQRVTQFKNEHCFDHWTKMFKYILPDDQSENNLNEDKNRKIVDEWTSSSLHFQTSKSKNIEEIYEFDFDECAKNPPQYLLKTFMKIIMTEGLLFQVFDPDVIFQYVFKFSTMLCSNCIQAAFTLHQIHHIIHHYFSIWFAHKFDLFIVYFASLIYYSRIPEIDDEFQIDQSNDNYQFIETNEEIVEKTKLQLHAINDKYSQNTRKYEFALDVFAECFKGIENNEMFIFFRSSINRILINLNDLMMFEMLGEFRVRIESPDFSIFHDDNDKVLFCSALIKFCQFGCYYQKESLMKDLIENINLYSFNQNERNNQILITEFHSFSIKIAQLWLEAFNQFTQMKYEEENLEKTKRYFESEQVDVFHDEC